LCVFSSFSLTPVKSQRKKGWTVDETARIPKKRKYAVRRRLTYSFEKYLNKIYNPKSTPLPITGNM